MRWCGVRARVLLSGLAVPMSIPRYTSAESTLMISNGNFSVRRMARSDFPEPVGPINKTAERRCGACKLTVRAKKDDQVRSWKDEPTWGGRDCTGQNAECLPYRAAVHSFPASSRCAAHARRHDKPWWQASG